MEQGIEAIDAPPIEGIAILIVTPQGWGGAPLTLTVGCGAYNPTAAILEGRECPMRRVQFEYRLMEPTTLINIDMEVPLPCHLHIEASASKGILPPMSGSVVVGVSDPGPIVIGLPYSIYSPLYLQ